MTTITERTAELRKKVETGSDTLSDAMALLSAVEKVLVLHAPFGSNDLAASTYLACPQDEYVWPCPTVAALAEALGVDDAE